jgi:hypothetical protein
MRGWDYESVYWFGLLYYTGLPWLGDIWLDGTVRLGAPSRQDDDGGLLGGARTIEVNAMVDCIDPGRAAWAFQQFIRELAVFLTVAGKYTYVSEQVRVWTWASDASGKVEYGVRNVGYWETNGHPVMPAAGTCHAVPLRPADALPDGTEVEAWLRDDVIELWSLLRKLNSDKRRQFLQAATKLHEAFSLGRERETLSFALLVVSCEALKPTGSEFRDHNVYDVIEALLGRSVADRLRQHAVPPQSVRNTHLHVGEFRGSEAPQRRGSRAAPR